MGHLGEISVGDIRRGLARYKPAALVVAGIVVVVALTPGGAASSGAGADADPLAIDASETPFAAVADEETAVDAGAADAPDDVSFDLPPPSPSFRRSPGGATSRPSASPSPSPSTFPTGVPPSSGSTFPDEGGSEPLRPIATAWASAEAGTPVAAAGVPEATLPVGNRIGQLDKASFVRLAGDATELVLVEDADGSRAAPTGGAAAVQACRIEVPGWEEAEAQSFDEAPTWDAASCTPGTRGDDGSWTFDLAGFGSPTDERGFALVPTDDAPVDFQVAFVDTTAGGG